jgi:hypothetical protein
MSRTVVVLLGSKDSGKSSTIDAFFKSGEKNSERILKTEMGKVMAYKRGSSSPQESSGFKDVSKVTGIIKKRLKKIDYADYVLILPFSVPENSKTERVYKRRTIIEPIKTLKNWGYDVLVIYLKREDKHKKMISLLNKLCIAHTTESKKDKYKSQAKELEEFLVKAYQP